MGNKMEKAKSQYGTFRESMRAPIHSWFTYPAGYSYRLVEVKIEEAGLDKDSLVLDPFLGSGTTGVAAKFMGIPSVGYEAHPFVQQIATAKLDWDVNTEELRDVIDAFAHEAAKKMPKLAEKIDLSSVPELLPKCYSDQTLRELLGLWKLVQESIEDPAHVLFFKVAMTNTLRVVSSAGTGWPYIAPSKFAEKKVDRPALPNLLKRLDQMVLDLEYVQGGRIGNAKATLVSGDSRKMSKVKDASVDLVVTSPPYLNNFDYADRTRLEMYFFGDATSWGDITTKVRDKLVIAATTQVNGSTLPEGMLKSEIRDAAPKVHKDLMKTITALGLEKKLKKGKKNYDWMVAGYFNGIFDILAECARTVKVGGEMHWVLGDSAPYGIHIPTEKFIGDLALELGFASYTEEILRTRGDKWKNNPQRHGVALQESIITIKR
jgi:DNA modification methylase